MVPSGQPALLRPWVLQRHLGGGQHLPVRWAKSPVLAVQVCFRYLSHLAGGQWRTALCHSAVVTGSPRSASRNTENFLTHMHSTLPWKSHFFQQASLATVAAWVLVPARPSGGYFISLSAPKVLKKLGKNLQRQRPKQDGSRVKIIGRVYVLDSNF